MKLLSFIIPSRNNLRYLKNAYQSIRDNLGSHHEICMADDASSDSTWDWMVEISNIDKNVKTHKNEGPDRLGHCVLYDVLINEYSTNDIFCIFHADMVAAKGMDVEMLKHIDEKTIVSATRIEPPLHPTDPAKVIKDFGIEPSEFDVDLFNDFVEKLKFDNKNKITGGVFAPWICHKKSFQSIGGHDQDNFSPQSKEDSDYFNRFMLNGGKFIQSWEAYVYHLTCRGSRFKDGAMRNPAGQVFMKNRESSEWLAQNLKSTRNFIRKWGHMVKHDEYLKPIIPSKYNVGFIANNCDINLLKELEPWCSTIYCGLDFNSYIEDEQPNTSFDLRERVQPIDNEKNNDILIEFDCKLVTPQNFQILVNLSEILQESGEVGEMKLEIFKFNIKKLDTYERELINVK
ncbi:MAG: glycosyltransferase [Candidatus Marinimicrobia bacterium]|nr:glycosyltransferase [Candidatus Neomarinimicrobiota bacterium]